MNASRVIAIDGAAGSGKSTLARGLARRLRLPYVNTGLMYRALAAAALRSGVDPDDGGGVLEVTRGLRFTIVGGDPPTLEVEGSTPLDLTSLDVERTVSAASRHPAVREEMRRAQRALGLDGGAVMEGRDIGSVVFPDAAVKLYLVADATARETRRVDERSGDDVEIATSLHARDAADARTNPFEPPRGADVIDTGRLSIEATLRRALEVIHERAPWLLTEGRA